MFVIAVLVWTSLMFDIAVVATVIAGLTLNVAVVDSNKGQAKNIDHTSKSTINPTHAMAQHTNQ